MRKKLLGLLIFFVLCVGVVISYKYLTYKPLNLVKQEFVENIVKNKKDAIIYIGRPSCPDCEKFKPILEKNLKNNHKSLYYFNIESTGKEKQTIREYLKSLGVNYIPIVVVIKNGKVIQILDGEKDFIHIKKLIDN